MEKLVPRRNEIGHGTRRRWTLRRINEIQAINETVRKAYA